MRIFLGITGFILFIAALALALFLLTAGKFSGTEFTAFVIAFAVLGLVLGYGPEVQEISVVGSVVKLKEVKAEALKAIESLNKSRVEMLRIFLGLAVKHGGGFGGDNPVDPRSKGFWDLVNLAREYKCVLELKQELLIFTRVLMIAQLSSIKSRNSSVQVTEPFLAPVDLAQIAFQPPGIEEAASRRFPTPTNLVDGIKESLVEYTSLYNFQNELERL